jgi:hypothetical protein
MQIHRCFGQTSAEATFSADNQKDKYFTSIHNSQYTDADEICYWVYTESHEAN